MALGATPTLTLELELELEPVEDELLVLLLEELLLDLPPDFPAALGLELDAALTPRWKPAIGRWIAMLPSMGASPKAIVISQRVRPIVLSVLTVCATSIGTQSYAERAQKPTTTRVSYA